MRKKWGCEKAMQLCIAFMIPAVIITGCNLFTDSNSNDTILEEHPDIALYPISLGWNVDGDGAGRLWSKSQDGLYRYTYATDEWDIFLAEDHDSIKADSFGQVMAADNEIWISYGWEGGEDGGQGLGVSRWNPNTGDYSHYDHTVEGFSDGPVWGLARDSDDRIWATTRFGAGASYFDGDSWNSFNIEDISNRDRYFDCNSVRFDSVGRGYFVTWRGGLHVYDFNTESWLHTEKGAAEGSESFLSRGIHTNDISMTEDGSELFIATSNYWSEEVGDADGVWHYKDEKWHNIAPEEEEVWAAARDAEGNIWSVFSSNYQLRKYNGSEWELIQFNQYTPTEDDYLQISYVDNQYIWLRRIKDGDWENGTVVRYRYR